MPDKGIYRPGSLQERDAIMRDVARKKGAKMIKISKAKGHGESMATLIDGLNQDKQNALKRIKDLEKENIELQEKIKKLGG